MRMTDGAIRRNGVSESHEKWRRERPPDGSRSLAAVPEVATALLYLFCRYFRNWSASLAMLVADALTFFFCTNWPISSLSPLAKASGAAEPCAMLGVSDALLNSPMNL